MFDPVTIESTGAPARKSPQKFATAVTGTTFVKMSFPPTVSMPEVR